ncbi:winged helix-turn-helix domain-containing protein [Phormidium tenue FACHB-886]|nr:winged helix-turn-helix domain-containing protein [Phormidium tenue FACHB-886]
MSGNQFHPDTNRDKQTKLCQLLTPFQRKLLQKSLEDELPPQYALRINIMLLADEGKTQTQICQALGCSQGTARHWVLVARSGQAHCWQESRMGRPKNVNEHYLERMRELVSRSPKEFGYSFRYWTAQWLSKHLAKEFGIEVSDRHINRLLKEMGLSTRSKSTSNQQDINETDAGTNITIRDLQSTVETEFSIIYPSNSIR